jgi:hypothetical protein
MLLGILCSIGKVSCQLPCKVQREPFRHQTSFLETGLSRKQAPAPDIWLWDLDIRQHHPGLVSYEQTYHS